MSDLSAEVEALTLSLMRAWVAGDAKSLKKLTARDYMMMVGANPPMLLDRPSFLAAAPRAFVCRRFAFREVLAREHSATGTFTAGAELDCMIGQHLMMGQFLVSACWIRSSWTYKWKAIELSIARLDNSEALPAAVRKLQLWKWR